MPLNNTTNNTTSNNNNNNNNNNRYFHFLILIKTKQPTEFTGPESHIHGMLHNAKVPDLSWFPHRCAMSLEVGHTEDEQQQLALEAMTRAVREELRQARWDVSTLTDTIAALKRDLSNSGGVGFGGGGDGGGHDGGGGDCNSGPGVGGTDGVGGVGGTTERRGGSVFSDGGATTSSRASDTVPTWRSSDDTSSSA